MSTEKIIMQQQFEEWARSQCMQLKKDGVATTYAYERTDLAWSAWQASRAAIEVELPELRNVPDRDCWARTNALGYNTANHECREAIKSLCLKVKPC